MVALSERALERARGTRTPRYYFDLMRELKAQRDEHTTAWTAAVSLVLGLNKSLEMIHAEGLPQVFARHRVMAEATLRVLLSDPLNAQGVGVFRRYPQLKVDVKTGLKPEELAEIIAPYHGLVVRSATHVTREVVERADSLRVIGRAGVGVDNIDLEAATRRGIVVMNSPLGNSVTTAEHAISMMMALARHIPAANAAVRAGRWDRSKVIGIEVCNKTLGLIGLGNIRASVDE